MLVFPQAEIAKSVNGFTVSPDCHKRAEVRQTILTRKSLRTYSVTKSTLQQLPIKMTTYNQLTN